jgi:hypothetical protein
VAAPRTRRSATEMPNRALVQMRTAFRRQKRDDLPRFGDSADQSGPSAATVEVGTPPELNGDARFRKPQFGDRAGRVGSQAKKSPRALCDARRPRSQARKTGGEPLATSPAGCARQRLPSATARWFASDFCLYPSSSVLVGMGRGVISTLSRTSRRRADPERSTPAAPGCSPPLARSRWVCIRW